MEQTREMVAPGGQLRREAAKMPRAAKMRLKEMARRIMRERREVRVFATAGGSERRAITRMAPTTCTRRTTVMAMRERRRK